MTIEIELLRQPTTSMEQSGTHFTASRGTPICNTQRTLLCELGVHECNMPQTMHEACAMIANILATLSPPHVPPQPELLLFLRKSGVIVIPMTQDEAIRLAHDVTMTYELFASMIAEYGLSWNPEDNPMIPAILRKCYRRYGQPFPDCWIDAVHWLATVANAEQRRIVPLCIAHVQHEARAVEIHALQLATDALIAQCLQEEYDISAQIRKDATVAQHLSRS